MQTNMKISKATLKDCIEIHRLASMPGLANPEGKAPVLCWIKSFVTEKKYAYVMRDGTLVVAFVLAERTCGGVALVWMLGVNEKYRNRDLATMIVKHCQKQMKADGVRVVIAYGYTKNPVVKHLFKKLKYEGGNTYTEYIKFMN